MKTRILSLFAALTLLLSLTACSADGKYSKQCEEAAALLTSGQLTEALDAYSAAIELDSAKAEAYIGRGNVYLALAETEDAPEASFSAARTDFEAAVAIDGSNAELWQKLSEVCLSLGDQDAAVQALEQGAEATSDETLKSTLAELQVKLEAQDVLRSIPYFGDVTRCTMTAEQAVAYAQLIADGIAGKNKPFSGYGSPMDDVVFWEEPYTVDGYGRYKTNRTNVLLGDFAGDGNPYLYVSSSLVDYGSFEVYGWADGAVHLAVGAEDYEGRESSDLFETKDGRVEISISGSMGAASHAGSTYVFKDGTAEEVYTWEETFDYEANVWRIIKNGVETVYTEDEYQAYLEGLPEGESSPDRDLPYAPFEEVLSAPATLRDMIDALNRYAAILSDGKAQAVTVSEPSADRLMAKAMLAKLAEYNSIENAMLYDLDNDGQKELAVAYAKNGLYADVFDWKNGSLSVENYGDGMTEQIAITKNTPTGEYGIRISSFTGQSSTSWYYPSQELHLSVYYDYDEETDEGYSEYYKSSNSGSGEISEQEYEKTVAENPDVETLFSYYDCPNRLEETRAALSAMLKS